MASELKAGRYEISSELGRGGMGVVYRARDSRLGRTVALKMIAQEVLHNTELRRRLGQEARSASALNHPGVATVFDFVDQGAESFIVYEYVEGVTLRQKLSQRRFSPEQVIEIGIQLADTMSAAHEHGIVHRDLKPENVMLTSGSGRSGQVKILDFGLAKNLRLLASAGVAGDAQTEISTASTAPGLLIGTVNYMSPEQLEGEPADLRSDIFALGLVLYEMTAGANPFVGKTSASTIANIIGQEAPPVTARNPAAPAELDRILRKCLRKRREERYQSARELLVDLSNLRRDSGEVAPPVAAAAGPLEIPRGLARALFLAIQIGYLVMYGLAFYDIQRGSRSAVPLLDAHLQRGLSLWLVTAALVGVPLRLYLLSAVVFDYVDTGRLFRQMFPVVVLFDLAWAVSPLLLHDQLGLAVLLLIPPLAYLPFSQRTLVLSAYGASGGRTSGIRSPSAP